MLGIELIMLVIDPLKKPLATVLLRNFYIGITSWYRYVLDTITGGNFLGINTLEAFNVIESLVGTPPTNDSKIEITLEHVMQRLEVIEDNVPSTYMIREFLMVLTSLMGV